MKVSFDFDVPLDRLSDPGFMKTMGEFLLALGGKTPSPAIFSAGASPEATSEKKRGRRPIPKPPAEPSFTPDPAAMQHLFDNLEGDAKVLIQEMYQRGSLNMEEAQAVLGGNHTDRNVGGTIGAVKRWATTNGMYPPYLREKNAAGKSVWHWLGTAFMPSASTSLSTRKDTPVRKETRGRKKKAATVSENTPQESATKAPKRGRPRKTESSAPTETGSDSEPVAPKKRGRPLKNTATSEVTPEAPKKRGRPRKNPLAPPQLHTNKMSPMGGKKSTFLHPQKQTSVKAKKKGRPGKSERGVAEIEKILARAASSTETTVTPTDSTTAIVPVGQKEATKTKGRKKAATLTPKTKVAAKKTKTEAKKTKAASEVAEPEKPVTETKVASAVPVVEATTTQEKRPEPVSMSEIPASVGKKGWVKKSARQANSSGAANELRRIVSLPALPQK